MVFKIRLKIVTLVVFGLGMQACANQPAKGNKENFVVFRLTLPAYATVKIRNVESKETKSVKLKHLRDTYFAYYLPAGVYEFSNYKPFKNVDLSTGKKGVRFEVFDNCTNYLGKLNLLGDYFHSNNKPTEIFWEYDKHQVSSLSQWLLNKMKGSDICVPYEGEVGKYQWSDFESKILNAIDKK